MKKLAILIILVMITMIVSPAYAAVTSFNLAKSSYTVDESFVFRGEEEQGRQSVFIIIRGPTGDYKGMVSDPSSDVEGVFDTIPRPVEDYFTTRGTYNATAFTDDQKEQNGLTIKLQFDGTRVFLVPDFDLSLRPISDKTIEEENTLSFKAEVTDSGLKDLEFSLEKNPPAGAVINQSTGVFSWTPAKSQGTEQGTKYTFDVVVRKLSQEDRETVTITVTEPKPQPTTQPKPEPKEEPEPNSEPEPNEITLEVPASFVDKTKDPQYYIDRYNNEVSYKKWFDENYPQYSSIYQAVGLDEPKEIAPFVDPNLEPQYYIDRYNNEPKYKEWFDKTYPDITIYDAVGVDPPKIKEPEFGECGPGTELIDGKCQLVTKPKEIAKEGGGCLIATATYGSEMAPQVQLLREIRDGKVMNTESGAAFMAGFNQFYYSFSPTIADWERENPAFKEMVRVGLAPMLATLAIMQNADSESEVLGYGMAVIMMNVGMYVMAPAIVIYKIKNRV